MNTFEPFPSFRTPATRRRFLGVLGLAGGALAAGPRTLMAGPFKTEEWGRYIPTDKRLHPDWVRSLFAAGSPTTYLKSRGELRYIGMPVGGLFCGTLYLGGDGRLWNWDIFNQKTEGVLPRRLKWSEVGMDFQTGDPEIRPRDGATYVKPAVRGDSQDIAQGFAVEFQTSQARQRGTLDERGWKEISFTGQYPVGTVRYTDPESPLEVRMEAFSPFIPLDVENSSLPATVFEFTLTNRGSTTLRGKLSGWQQNAVCFHSAKPGEGVRVNQVRRGPGFTLADMSFEAARPDAGPRREDVLVEDFEKGYAGWQVEGEAFGTQPAERSAIPAYQGDVGGVGRHVVNSHASAPGAELGLKDDRKGRLRKGPFRIVRRHLSFYIGGGRRDDVGMRLRIDGRVVRSATGHNANAMRLESWDVTEFEGREAVLEIVDDASGSWGNIGVDHVVQTDTPRTAQPLDQRADFGTMAFAVADSTDSTTVRAAVSPARLPEAVWESEVGGNTDAGASPAAVLEWSFRLRPGKSVRVTFVLAWHFPRTTLPTPDARTGNHYATRFPDAAGVAMYVLKRLPFLASTTRRWRDTWHDSTLPQWFLERTMVNTSILATTTAHRFGTGRFWGWEGVGCCEGTCTHVWHYGQAMGRLFPEIERGQREGVDFGVGFETAQGWVRHRGEGSGPAIDGHCGRILGVWREHQMSADRQFLKRVWPRVKLAAEYVIGHDKDGDGVLDGAQENTLDAAWYGRISWITSLAVAALQASAAMADVLGDVEFAKRCRAQAARGRMSLETALFNGEYFIQIADPGRPRSLGTYDACHIDQVQGQSWAWQVGLGRVLDREKTVSALRALWKYNFTPDVAPFRKKYTAGRPYALAGDGGLIMTSNPQMIPEVYGLTSWQIGYFNECMSGFEHQAASHMIAEGLVLEGLAVVRAVHDRYHGARRNPFNEIECSDHYARAMASYGAFVTACGFECDGPSGHLGFAPRWNQERFKAAFTAAEGWGSYEQARSKGVQTHRIEVRHGEVQVRSVAFVVPAAWLGGRVTASVAGQRVDVRLEPLVPAPEGVGASLRGGAADSLEAGLRAVAVLGTPVRLQAGKRAALELRFER